MDVLSLVPTKALTLELSDVTLLLVLVFMSLISAHTHRV